MTIEPNSQAPSRRRRGPLRLIGLGLIVAAIVKELRLPAERRTWHGSVGGWVPYEFRRPTMERLRERLWSPTSAQVFTPTMFGVGWTVNVGRVIALVRDRAGRP